MNENYYSDCCWAYVEMMEGMPQTEEITMGKCTACGNTSGSLLTQEMINRKIKESLRGRVNETIQRK